MPRSNGEIVFDAPWQSRAFGLAVALQEGGVYEWRDFSRGLADEIRAAADDDGSGYYVRWLTALEQLLLERGVVTSTELVARAAEIERDDEHWHDHDHRHVASSH
ncbi:MAG: nitrile hydratase accessory protein [Mycobacteriales bacterium]